MSRVHDALRKAAQENPPPSPETADKAAVPRAPRVPSSGPTFAGLDPYAVASADSVATQELDVPDVLEDVEAAIAKARRMEFHPLSDALLVHPNKPREAPAEEFRTLRTRLNHLQTTQPIHTLVITSPSPAEGKSFTAANLALTQSQLKGKRILLADFDFRRPTVDKTFQVPISPGITNYLQGTAGLADIIMRIGDSNLYVLTAADGNLLATMSDGTVLVVRIGTTTYDSVARAVQSLCENNVVGIVVNGARRGELYSKYSYYHDYHYESDGQRKEEAARASGPVE
jgi:receptor protein-tyrosine kinase